MRNAEIRGVEQLPARFITQLAQPPVDPVPVAGKARIEHAFDILEHHGLGADFIDIVDADVEEIALVAFAQLFSGNREWRAGQTAGEEVNTLERRQVEWLEQIVFNHIPTWPVEPQCVAGMGIVLDQAGMLKARHFKTEGLPAGACAKFQCYGCHRFSPKSGHDTALRSLLNCPLYEQKQNIRNHLDVIGGSWTLTFVRVTAREGCGAYLLSASLTARAVSSACGCGTKRCGWSAA